MTWQTTKTSADYTPCLLLWPSGKTERKNIVAFRLDTVASAREKLARNVCAWVRDEAQAREVLGAGENGANG